jgi:hypothetical protein
MRDVTKAGLSGGCGFLCGLVVALILVLVCLSQVGLG